MKFVKNFLLLLKKWKYIALVKEQLDKKMINKVLMKKASNMNYI